MAGINFKQLRQDAMTILEGDFPATVSDCTAVVNSKGNPMLKVKFKIASGPYAGRPFWTNINITPSSQFAMKIFFRHMAAMGISDAFLDAEPEMEMLAAKLSNANCVIRLKKGSYQGVEREEVDDILPLGSPTSGGSGASALPTALPVALPVSLPGDAPAVEILPELPGEVNHIVPEAEPEAKDGEGQPEEPPLPF